MNNNANTLNYKILEWRLIMNRNLYENKIISLSVFSEIENFIIKKMEIERN